MSFTSLALKNIKKNFNNYIMYLVSAVFSVMVFNIFCSIIYNKQFMELADNKAIVKAVFQGSAFIVALFSFVFIWYSNKFFLKRRKKELAIYSMVGMEKKQIGRMLFYENLIIGALATLGGIMLGTIFSKYFFLMLVTVMKASVDVKFIISPKASGLTILVFFILFLVNSIYSYRIIYKYQLIELLAAQKEREREPKASVIMAILSIIFIICGYILANNKTSRELVKVGLPILILVSMGTYLLFNSLIILLVKTIKKNKSFYYRGENMIATSHILYRIKSNAKTLSIITLLSAATLTALGSTYSFYKTTEEALYMDVPFSYQFKNVDDALNEKVKATINSYSNNKLLSERKLKLIEAEVNVPVYKKTSFNGKIISQSDYNNAVEAEKKGSKIILKDNEGLFIERNQGDGIKRNYINSKASVKLNGIKKEVTITKTTDIQVISPLITEGTLILSDNYFNELDKKSDGKTFYYKGYMIQNPDKAKELTTELSRIIPKEAYIASYYETYQGYYKGSGIFIFIGMFLGILFFLATGSIISFKQLMEASEDEKRYAVLRNIGVSKKEIKKSISKQLLITFGMPLIIAICHSTAALIVNQNLMKEQTMNYCVIVMLFYILMYFIYYKVTVNSYTNIVCRSNSR